MSTTEDFAPLRALGRLRLEAVLTDEEMAQAAISALKESLKRRGRTAQRIYWKLVSECGVEVRTQIATQLYIQIGARDERDARRMIDIVREAEAKPIEQKVDDATGWFEQQLAAHPELRERVAERLLRFLVTEEIVVPLLNGHTP